MCISIVEAHLCGWRGSIIRTERCPAAVAVSHLLVAVFTAQDEQRLMRLRRECKSNSEMRDQVRIDHNCSACIGWVERLGQLDAQLCCGREQVEEGNDDRA